MKKTSFLVILLAALVLAAGVVTKDSELVKSYVPVFAGACCRQWILQYPKKCRQKRRQKTQDAVKNC